jgi:Leucine-rich repeat (LRR) protein
LFWYSPAADGHYKVVYADLSVHEVKKEHLPDKPIVPEIERTAVHDVVKALGPKNVVRVNTPRFELPPHAVKQFARLQEIRETGRQQQVEYLVLAHMPEFIENSISWEQFKKSGPVVVDPKSVPDRSPDSERLKFLTEFPNLKGLDVAHLYLTHKDLDIIGSCRKLERLSLSGVQVLETSARRLVGDDLKRFGALQHLQRLDLSQSNFVGGLMHLSRCSSLHTLYLSSFEHLNDRSVAELKVLPHLESLVLSPVYNVNSPEKCVSDHGLRSLQELPKLKNLFVGWHGKSTMPVDKLRELLPKVNVVPPR